MPLSELNESRVAIKSYRGWKSAINGVLQSGGCSEAEIKNNKIRVLPVTTVLQVDDDYEEKPVSDYFKCDVDLKRYIKTKKYNIIIDTEEIYSSPLNIRLHQERYGSQSSWYVDWYDKDKYGDKHHYYDKVSASSDNRKELENDQSY